MSSEGGVVAAEGDIVASEGGIIASEGGLAPSEGAIMHFEGDITSFVGCKATILPNLQARLQILYRTGVSLWRPMSPFR